MKVFLILVIIAAFSCIGYFVWEGYRRKKAFYSNILDFCLCLQGEIKFNKHHINKIILKYKSKYILELQKYMDGYLSSVYYQQTLLNAEEHAEVLEFFKSLGCYDVDGEVKNIDKYIGLFKNKLAAATEQEKNKGVATFKIFIIMGLLLAIIII